MFQTTNQLFIGTAPYITYLEGKNRKKWARIHSIALQPALVPVESDKKKVNGLLEVESQNVDPHFRMVFHYMYESLSFHGE